MSSSTITVTVVPASFDDRGCALLNSHGFTDLAPKVQLSLLKSLMDSYMGEFISQLATSGDYTWDAADPNCVKAPFLERHVFALELTPSVVLDVGTRPFPQYEILGALKSEFGVLRRALDVTPNQLNLKPNERKLPRFLSTEAVVDEATHTCSLCMEARHASGNRDL